MRAFSKILFVAFGAALAAGSTGCVYEREVVREERRLDPPPPPPGADERAEVDRSAPPPERDVEVDVFYERLSPWGYWTVVAPYGRVWVPSVAYGWRPYYYGQWVLTDWGWTFVSDDPWGWAAYHYGRWNFSVGIGWYWVPGTVWGPAWVEWRYGPGWVTWCPLAPRGIVFGYRHPAWVAVRERHFTRPIAAVAVSGRATAPIVHSTQPLAGAHATPARGGSFGPPVARVQSATGQVLRPVSARGLVGRPSARPQGTVDKLQRMHADSGAQLRSPMTPRVRSEDSMRARGYGDGSAPRARGSGPRAAPSGAPRGGDESAPRGYGGAPPPPSSSDGGGRSGGGSDGAPRARGGGESRAAPSGGGGGGGRPHASPGKHRD